MSVYLAEKSIDGFLWRTRLKDDRIFLSIMGLVEISLPIDAVADLGALLTRSVDRALLLNARDTAEPKPSEPSNA